MSGTGMQSTDDEEYLREMFTMFDYNKDESITVKELENLMQALGCNPTAQELQGIIKQFDLNKSGKIEWNEFRGRIKDFLKSNKTKQEIQNAFDLFDKNKDGYVSASELKTVLTKLGQKMSDEEVDEMISVADLDKDGRINTKEFVAFITKPIK